jgi:hypothetical protein
VVYTVDVILSGAALEMGAAVELGVFPAETGQTVVYKAIVEVTTMVELAGQLVTVAGHFVIVNVAVV